jgi:hypothetical protein
MVRDVAQSCGMRTFIRSDAVEALRIAEKGDSVLVIDFDIFERYPEFLFQLRWDAALTRVPILVLYDPSNQFMTLHEVKDITERPHVRVLTLPINEEVFFDGLGSILGP